MIAPGPRLISIAILIGWLAPSAAALGVGMHLAAEHHGPDGLVQQQEIADLVRAVTHGHHHDLETAPDHRHDARFDGRAPSSRPDVVAMATPRSVSPSEAEIARVANLEEGLRRGPSKPLFEVHCVLLI